MRPVAAACGVAPPRGGAGGAERGVAVGSRGGGAGGTLGSEGTVEVPVNDSGLVARWSSWTPYLRSVLRVVTAFLFMQVGTAKLFAYPAEIMPVTLC